MGAIPVHHTATSDKAWDGPAAKANLKNDGTREYYRSAYAWEDSDQPDSDAPKKSDFKFIHHEVDADGKVGAANLKGCSSGIGVLHGGRGGTTIPEGDKAGVERHLQAHIDDEEKGESPEKEKQEKEPSGKSALMAPSANRLPHVTRAICEIPWAIMPVKLMAILELVHLRAQGIKADDELLAQFQAATKPKPGQSGAIAVLPLVGTISHRMDSLSSFSGGMSTQEFTKNFRAAMADPSVGSVVIDCDSPGGTVSGVAELSDEIYKARGKKPLIAQVNALMASAAYWICSACDEIAITPTGAAGSIGVFAAHTDFSAADAAMGVKTTLISAGKFKTEGNEFEPLNDDARAAMQDMVDQYYGMFIKAVARNRSVSADDVRNGYGQGRVLTAQDAVKAGLADKVATFDQTLASLGATSRSVKTPMSEQMFRRRMSAARYGLSIEGEEERA